MKFFLDTEFIERGRDFPIQLISIGIVCENGEEYYAESSEFDPQTANAWVKQNVLTHLTGLSSPITEIAADVVEFVRTNAGESKPEFWGYYCDYDWVVLCQIFGTMMSLPKGWPMYCRDLKQLCDGCGNPKLPKQESTEHNALADARWNRQVYDFLTPAAAPASGTPLNALADAVGLCESEANRWTHDEKTSRHWREVAVQLRAQLLIAQVKSSSSALTEKQIMDFAEELQIRTWNQGEDGFGGEWEISATQRRAILEIYAAGQKSINS